MTSTGLPQLLSVGLKEMGVLRIFLPSGSSGSHYKVRLSQVGHYLLLSVGCMLIGTGLTSAGLDGLAGGFRVKCLP